MAAGTILVVDDNQDAGNALARLIQREGHQALSVASGEAALEWLAQRVPDLIILDEMMPGMSGIDVLRIVRTEPRLMRVPVILFSAISDPSFREYALSKGANEYWVKASFDFREIGQRIAPYVGDDRGNSPSANASTVMEA